MGVVRRRGLVHPLVHLFVRIGLYGMDGLDETIYLSRSNLTGMYRMDAPARSLKVATRVGIPLGLQLGLQRRDQFPSKVPLCRARCANEGKTRGSSGSIPEGI